MNKAGKTALGGIVTAISVAAMFLTAVIPFFTYILPIAAALLVAVAAEELGRGWATAVYFAVSILGILIVADKEAALMYIAFFGYYPLIKAPLDKLVLPLRLLLKFAVFNASVCAAYWLIIKLFGLDSAEFSEFGKYTVPILLVLGNAVFVLFDYVLRILTVIYRKRMRPAVSRIFRR